MTSAFPLRLHVIYLFFLTILFSCPIYDCLDKCYKLMNFVLSCMRTAFILTCSPTKLLPLPSLLMGLFLEFPILP